MSEAGCSSGMFTKRMYVGGGDIGAVTTSKQVRDVQPKGKPVEGSIEKVRGNCNEYVTDIDKLVISTEKMLEDVPLYMCSPGHPGRISRIPETLREVDVNAYEPYFLSFGPYHHGKQRVQHMEKRKHLVLKCVLESRPDLTLKDYLKEIKTIEPVVRSFYSHVEMDSEKFTQMLLLDSLFILTVFCGIAKNPERMRQANANSESGDGKNTNDNETNEDNNLPRWFWTLFAHDLFLVENQLPLFVLERIYGLTYGGHGRQLRGIMTVKLGEMLSNYTKLDSDVVISQNEEVHHLLHLCHIFFRPKFLHEFAACHLPESSQMFRLGSALQLYEAGVVFESRTTPPHFGFLDITFSRSGKLSMPCLAVDDNIISLLRNLIALEQMKYPNFGLHICAYAVLLLHLVTIPEDVELLRKKGIIQHHLASDKDMMLLVNRLSVGLSFDYIEDIYSLKPVFLELNQYSKRRLPRWKAWLRIRYFNNPWTAVSLFAASFLLILSGVQTFYTVYSYYNPCFGCHL